MKKQHDPRYFKPYSGVECIFPAYKATEKVEAQKQDDGGKNEQPKKPQSTDQQ